MGRKKLWPYQLSSSTTTRMFKIQALSSQRFPSARIWKVRSKGLMLHVTYVTFQQLSLSLSLSTLETPIMAWALFSPSLNLSLPHTTKTNFNRTQWFTTKTSRAATTTTTTRRTTSIRANAADKKQPKDKDEDTTSGFSPFAFVTEITHQAAKPFSSQRALLKMATSEKCFMYVFLLSLTIFFNWVSLKHCYRLLYI